MLLALQAVRAQAVWPLLLVLLAVAVPLLIGGSLSPSSTFFNQVCAVFGWGLALALWDQAAGPVQRNHTMPRLDRRGASLACLLAALAVLLLAILASAAPVGQRLAPWVCVALAAVTALASAQGVAQAAPAASASRLQALPPAVLLALLFAGLYSVLAGLLQVFLPDWTDGHFFAHRTAEGLAIGNIRQPNQLSTLLLWACAAAVWWSVLRKWNLAVLAGLLAALLFTVVLTASRTGVIGVVMLALWGLVDRRLPGRVRLLLLASPVFYALAWWGMTQWAAAAHHAFHGGERMTATLHGYGSDSRVNTWLNTWALIKTHPWAGVGFGAYNFAWTLTPFPGRSTAFFDHSHNLLLQWAVEFGVPVALLVLGLLAASLWTGRRALTAADDERALSARTALFMLAIVAVHSLLEYPLWYAYFLLPTAALWGWYAGLAREAAETASLQPSAAKAGEGWGPRSVPRLIVLSGMLAVAASAYAFMDFWRVATIFEPHIPGGTAPLAERIERGRRGLLFGQHADYARVTMAERPQDVFDSFDRPLFHLLDTRLMIAYAKALAGRGEVDKARDVAARLREFNKPEAEEFFEVCQTTPAAFQCGPDPALAYEALLPAKR
ncbi:MAG TPA: Wzy polymerase domain-containing protein [Burkholderiaceae bacterium]|nr:Wzy polymerase domain-containing protein [Burkholderiaceae bacterium]